MSGPIPTAIRAKMQAPPATWNPQIQVDDKQMFWRGTVNACVGGRVEQLRVEYGFSRASRRDASEIKRVAWEISELARLGYVDLIAWARTDRHRGRVGSKPTITAENMGQEPFVAPAVEEARGTGEAEGD